MEQQLEFYLNKLLKPHKKYDSYIYNDFPFDYIYETSKKEASRKKPIFFLHKYFARRTTCNFRLMLLSMLNNKSDNVCDCFHKSCKLDDNENLVLLDPFMGGGTTIYEALRLNMNVIGNDLQPISKFVTLAEILPMNKEKLNNTFKEIEKSVGEKIKKYYKTECPHCKKKADVMYNFHVKYVYDNNKKIKLYSSHILAKKNKNITYICPNCEEVITAQQEGNTLICNKCNHIFDLKDDSSIKKGKIINTDKSLLDYRDSNVYPFKSDIVAIEYYCPFCKSHAYKTPSKEDIELYENACIEFDLLKHPLIPNVEIPQGYNTNQILNHGYKKFSDLFNKRQLLCLSYLLESIEKIGDEETKFWFLVTFSGMLEMNNMFCRYQTNAYKICNIFFNHAYVPITMPTENCVWGTNLGTGTFIKTLNKIIKGKEFSSNIYDILATKDKSDKVYTGDTVLFYNTENINELTTNTPYLSVGDSCKLTHIKDDFVDIILTDPPYSDNVMYSELLDFFHSWMHLSQYAQKKLDFKTPLTPKIEEIVVNKSQNKNHEFYSSGLEKVFSECNRVLKKDGIMAFTYHDKNIDGWKSIFTALVNSNFQITCVYPVHSESRTGAHTSSKESIAFDMFLVCNKRINNIKLDKSEILESIVKVLTEYITRLNDIQAELTRPDIENIFVSLLFSNLSLNSNINDSMKIFDELYEDKENIISNIKIKNLVNKRTGWWAELHKK